jgi:hypothetical protein
MPRFYAELYCYGFTPTTVAGARHRKPYDASKRLLRPRWDQKPTSAHPAKSRSQEKRVELSGTAPVVRLLDAERKNRIPDHEEIAVITHTTLVGITQLPGAFQ